MNSVRYNQHIDLPPLRVLQALTALLVAVALQTMLLFSNCELPQAGGSSMLALISDDTRMVFSSALLQKSDEYFHGGVRVHNCGLQEHAHDHDHEHAHDHDHDHSALSSTGGDPFQWINQRIHAQEHRHLSADSSVELLPWVYAATKASAHNVQAYEIGAYILSDMMKKPQVAIEFLQDGIRKNPESVELELSLGRLYFSVEKNMETARIHFQRALEKSLGASGEFDENDKALRLNVCFYLGKIAHSMADVDSVRRFYKIAAAIEPNSVYSITILKWLNELESTKEKSLNE